MSNTNPSSPPQFTEPCPAHNWGQMPTVGGYYCQRCKRTVMHSDPEYVGIDAAYHALLRAKDKS